MSIKQAIEALEVMAGVAEMVILPNDPRMNQCNAALAALRSMPAEPVAWLHTYQGLGRTYQIADIAPPEFPPYPDEGCKWIQAEPLYATPHTEAVQDDCDTVDRLLKGLGLDPERCRTEGWALNVGRTLSLLQDGCTNRCPTADLESAAMEMYERSGGKDWMREPETEKWRAIANIGFKWPKPGPCASQRCMIVAVVWLAPTAAMLAGWVVWG